MPREQTAESAAPGEITQETRMPLAMVVTVVMTAISLTGVYFKLQGEVAQANSRIDAVERAAALHEAALDRRFERLEKITCTMAKKQGLFIAECQ